MPDKSLPILPNYKCVNTYHGRMRCLLKQKKLSKRSRNC